MKLCINSETWMEILLANRGSSNMGNVLKHLYNNTSLHPCIVQATSFCVENTDIPKRLKYLVNGSTSMNYCKFCNTLINDGGKTSYCNPSCRAKSYANDKAIMHKRSQSMSTSYAAKSLEEKNITKVRRKQTLQDRYGVVHNFNIEGFQEKRKQTWKEKYGTEVAQQSNFVKDKTRKTCEKLYNGPNPLSDPVIKQKWFETFWKKHKERNPMQVDQIKRKNFATKLQIDENQVVFSYEKTFEKLDTGEKLKYGEYVEIVRFLTGQTLSEQGFTKFGESWKTDRGKYQKHIDHSVSIRTGFVNDVNPRIISHIENLELIEWQENLSKGAKDSITIEELYSKIQNNKNNNNETKTS